MTTVVMNRHKYRVANAYFNGGPVPTSVRMGLIMGTDANLPAGALDPDLNTVSQLLAVATIDEPTDGSYARVTMSSVSVTEDDTNDRAAVDFANVDFGVLDNTSVMGAFVYTVKTGDASDTDYDLVLVTDDNFPKVANGAGFVVNVADLLRLI